MRNLYRTYNWSRTELLALSNPSCDLCFGLGKSMEDITHGLPCYCVLRQVFRECLDKYKQIKLEELQFNCNWEYKGKQRVSFAFKNQEYAADFELLARRKLTSFEYKVLTLYFVEDRTYSFCCSKLKINKGNFYHTVYRIEYKLGQTFRSVRPYPIYPVDEYFSPRRLDHPIDRINKVA